MFWLTRATQWDPVSKKQNYALLNKLLWQFDKWGFGMSLKCLHCLYVNSYHSEHFSILHIGVVSKPGYFLIHSSYSHLEIASTLKCNYPFTTNTGGHVCNISVRVFVLFLSLLETRASSFWTHSLATPTFAVGKHMASCSYSGRLWCPSDLPGRSAALLLSTDNKWNKIYHLCPNPTKVCFCSNTDESNTIKDVQIYLSFL